MPDSRRIVVRRPRCGSASTRSPARAAWSLVRAHAVGVGPRPVARRHRRRDRGRGHRGHAVRAGAAAHRGRPRRRRRQPGLPARRPASLLLLADDGRHRDGGRTARWRSRGWPSGLAVFAVGDTIYLFQTANGTYLDGGLQELSWTVGFALMALAARTDDAPEDARRGPTGWRRSPGCRWRSPRRRRPRRRPPRPARVRRWARGSRSPPSPRRSPASCSPGSTPAACAQARHDAQTDPLTGLPNRRAYYLAVDGWFADGPASGSTDAATTPTARTWPSSCSTSTASRTSTTATATPPATRSWPSWPSACGATVRSGDHVVRLAGDEFVVVARCGTVRRPHESEAAAARLVDAARPAGRAIGEASFRLGASAGIARHPEHGTTPDELLAAADLAMYAAKRDRSAYRTYEVDAHLRRAGPPAPLHELRQALDGGQLVLAFQPQADATHGGRPPRRGARALGPPDAGSPRRPRSSSPSSPPPGSTGASPRSSWARRSASSPAWRADGPRPHRRRSTSPPPTCWATTSSRWSPGRSSATACPRGGSSSRSPRSRSSPTSTGPPGA